MATTRRTRRRKSKGSVSPTEVAWLSQHGGKGGGSKKVGKQPLPSNINVNESS